MAEVRELKRRARASEVFGFGCGAVVALKCGGQEMVVREAIVSDGAPMVRCDWHLDDGSPVCADYFVAQLGRVEELAPDPEPQEPAPPDG